MITISEKISVLVVEDDEKLRNTLMDYLQEKGFLVHKASDGQEALDVFHKIREIDIILLDVMLPKLDGIEVLKKIRLESSIPVIMLSARETEHDQLVGLREGADLYITKPFFLSVLKEQMLSLLRRIQKNTGDMIARGVVRIDMLQRKIYVEDEEISVTPKEYDLLLFFLHNEGIVFSRDTILDRVWGMDYFGDFRTVDTIIKQIRKKLGSYNGYIKSVYGVGYYFEVEDS